MSIPLKYLIYVYWALATTTTVVFISLTVRAALAGKASDVVKWRMVKVISASLGLVGLFLFAINFEQTVRSLTDESPGYIQSLYFEMKINVLYNQAVVCAKERQPACSDFTHLRARSPGLPESRSRGQHPSVSASHVEKPDLLYM